MKFIITVGFSLSLIVGLEVIILTLATGYFPNQFELEIFNNLSMYLGLLKSSPLTILNLLLIQKPFIIIQNTDITEGTQIWGLYIMPITFITLVALSIMVAKLRLIDGYLTKKYWILLASTLLTLSVFYLRLQSCCSASPNWVFDVFLLVRVFDPTLDTMFWQDVYLFMTPWFKSLQFIVATSALLLFYKCFSKLKLENKSPK